MNITNWNEKIIWDADDNIPPSVVLPENNLAAPLNKALETGDWTQSIIWGPREPFKDFTQLELEEHDVTQDDRPASQYLWIRVSFHLCL